MDYTVKRRTLRVDMQMNTIILKMGELLSELAEVEGVPEVVIDMELSKFAKLSVRMEAVPRELDFDLIRPGDPVENIREKFGQFLDTEMVETVDEMVSAINKADAAAVPVHAPDAKKKTTQKG